MNLYNLCLAVLIKHKIEVEKCYVEVNKLLDEYKYLEVENPILIEIKLYLKEINYRQREDLIKKYFDNEEIVCIILKYYNLFRSISDRLKNKKEICLIAVKKYGLALQFVNVKTKEICLIAVQQNGLALQFVNVKTKEICLAAVQQNGLALRLVPNKFKTKEIYLAAVRRYGLALQFVPNELKTKEICLAAVQQYGLALQFVPNELKKKIRLILRI